MKNSGGAVKLTRWLHRTSLSNKHRTFLCDFRPSRKPRFGTSIQEKYFLNLQGKFKDAGHCDQILPEVKVCIY